MQPSDLDCIERSGALARTQRMPYFDNPHLLSDAPRGLIAEPTARRMATTNCWPTFES